MKTEWKPGDLAVTSSDGGRCDDKIHVVDRIVEGELGPALCFKPCECFDGKVQSDYAKDCRRPTVDEAGDWWFEKHDGHKSNSNGSLGCLDCKVRLCVECMHLCAEGKACRCGEGNPAPWVPEVGEEVTLNIPKANDSFDPDVLRRFRKECDGKVHRIRRLCKANSCPGVHLERCKHIAFGNIFVTGCPDVGYDRMPAVPLSWCHPRVVYLPLGAIDLALGARGRGAMTFAERLISKFCPRWWKRKMQHIYGDVVDMSWDDFKVQTMEDAEKAIDEEEWKEP